MQSLSLLNNQYNNTESFSSLIWRVSYACMQSENIWIRGVQAGNTYTILLGWSGKLSNTMDNYGIGGNLIEVCVPKFLPPTKIWSLNKPVLQPTCFLTVLTTPYKKTIAYHDLITKRHNCRKRFAYWFVLVFRRKCIFLYI
mgnify:CR=1 FL=1